MSTILGNSRGLTVTKGAAPRQILAVVDPQVSFTVQMNKAAGIEVDGRKIIKAGTPLAGELTKRHQPFVPVNEGYENRAAGVALHDYDVTDGDIAGALLVFGFVDMKKMEEDVVAKITPEVLEALQGRVTFIK